MSDWYEEHVRTYYIAIFLNEASQLSLTSFDLSVV